MGISLSILLIFLAVTYYILIVRSSNYEINAPKSYLLDLRSDESNWIFMGPGFTSRSTSGIRGLESLSILAIFLRF